VKSHFFLFYNTKVTISTHFFIILKKKNDQRDVFIKKLREGTIGSVSTQSSSEEMFQNEVLRLS
jgi:hypothetical protein